MKATSFLLPVLPAFLLLLVHPVKAQTSLAEMDAAYDAAIARIEKPQVDLLAKYQEGLRALQERKRAAGDLEAVLALTREIETAAQETKRDFESQPDLKRLREIYETNLARLREDASKEHARVRGDYRARLLAATERLTREGKIDEAVQLKAPWAYYNEMDHRTMKNLLGKTEMKKLTAKATLKHDALDDARTQALTLNNVFNKLGI